MTFSSDGTALGTVGLTGTAATLSTAALPAGTHTITAAYNGDVSANLAPSTATLSQTVNPLAGLADPDLDSLASALSDAITDSAGNKIITFGPACAATGPYQGLSDLDKLALSVQTDDGCLQFITTYTGPPAAP